MSRRIAIALLFSLIAVNLASAGVIRVTRHVVKPVVKTAAKTTGKVVSKTAHVVKHVAY